MTDLTARMKGNVVYFEDHSLKVGDVFELETSVGILTLRVVKVLVPRKQAVVELIEAL